ncbi:hypothetical protein D9619_013519 [Psilocybe cf. subviscida]|uniref:Uncharacterized protein n=1 Tax=Psilocybe cf. subviscida TaxID=2480587 RepID=A0A8H5F4E6_9AGAR|nr:hypothetical protein D9619_013519 [Psilocybe cf. subviscida]
MSEPTELKIFEHAYYIGNYAGGVLCGVNLTVYVLIMQALFDGRNSRDAISKKRFHAIFATSMIVILAIEAVLATFWGEEMWIVSRDNILAGGVPGFILTKVNVWYAIFRAACGDALAALGDAFLLYRLFTIYGSNYAVVVLPSLVYLASIAVGVVQLTSTSTGNFFHGSSVDWNRAYFTLTVSFNLLVTILILLRLRKASKAVRGTSGHDSSRIYSTISAMIIESAAIYAVFTVTFTVVYSVGSPVSVGFGNATAKVVCLTPLLIILRVVNRTARNKNVMAAGSQSHGMKFMPGVASTTTANTQEIQLNQRSTLDASGAIDKHGWNRSDGSMV